MNKLLFNHRYTSQEEEDLHDEWAISTSLKDIKVNESFEACTAVENRIIMKYLGDVRNLYVLDLGCGLGEASVYFAKLGARVVSIDISNGMLSTVKKLAEMHGVSVETKKAFSHNTGFENNTFDVVYTSNLLHHVDLDLTLKECHRILKRGGKFVSWDPLAHNPVINMYRKIADRIRTKNEHPIKINQLKYFCSYFSIVKVETTWFFTLYIFIKYYFFDRIDPNKQRYWKKIIVDYKEIEKIYNILEKIDITFLRIFSFFRKYCWNIVVMAKKM